MNVSATAVPTVRWKWPCIQAVLWIIAFIA